MLNAVIAKAKADACVAWELHKDLQPLGEPEREYNIRRSDDALYMLFVEQGKAQFYTRNFKDTYRRVFSETWDECQRKAGMS